MVSALVSIAIVGIFVLTVINLIGISGEVLQSFQSSIRAMDTAQEVRFALADANTCTLNLRGLDITAATTTNPVRVPGDLRYPEPNDRTRLSPKLIVNIDNEEGEQLVLDGIFVRRSVVRTLAYIDVRLRKKGTLPGSPPSHARAVPIWVSLTPANIVTCCTTLNMSACP